MTAKRPEAGSERAAEKARPRLDLSGMPSLERAPERKFFFKVPAGVGQAPR